MNEERPSERQLVFGLDAAEWSLVKRLADEGKMPTFKALMERGASGPLRTTAGQLPDTVWSCIYGGRNPATFDKHFYVQYDARTRDLRHVEDDAFTKRPFWDVLSDAGRKVGVVDAVKFTTSERLNGFQLTNWGAHATKAPRSSVPADLFDRVVDRFGMHPVQDCDKVDADKPAQLLDLKRRCVEGVRLRGEVNRWLMTEREWDVLFLCYSEPHCIGHHFWHWADPSHPRHGEAGEPGLKDAVESVYVAMDEEIGKTIELAGDDVQVMIVAGHGMGSLYHASWNLQEMLDLLGFGRGPASRVDASAPKKARTNFWRKLKMVVPGRVQYAIKGMLPQSMQHELVFKWYAGNRDWAGRRAFPVPNNDAVGAIRVSVQGRDKDGVVPPEEYRAVCEEIKAALEELTDPATGKKVVDEVVLCRDRFKGEFEEQLPDLTVHWNASFPWSAVESPRFGRLELTNQDGRTGSHTAHGFCIVAGPHVPAGRALEGRSIYDIAPTILATAGVDVPAEMEGEPLPVLGGAVSV
ncbi:MAG: alkaline phosphatase family protein [Planctomycetota bacterium JB042]